MGECNDIKALENIKTEVDESMIKIFLSRECFKSQILLVNWLKKESKKHKEVCLSMNNANSKIEAEIRNGVAELKSMRNALDNIKFANINIKRDWLLAKEMKLENIKRMERGVKKYDDLWTQSKKRYESIPIVQKWLELNTQTQVIQNHIKEFSDEEEMLKVNIKNKKQTLVALEKKLLIELSNFMLRERPRTLELIAVKENDIKSLNNEIKAIEKQKEFIGNKAIKEKTVQKQKEMDHTSVIDDDWPQLYPKLSNVSMTLEIPTLELSNIETKLPIADVNTKKLTSTPINPELSKKDRADYIKNESFAACYMRFFNSNYSNMREDDESKENISAGKLIHVLEDISVDKSIANTIVSCVDPTSLQVIDAIVAKNTEEAQNTEIGDENIEIIDITEDTTQDILLPPTQFEDRSQFDGQENTEKKKVSFNIPHSQTFTDDDIYKKRKENNTEVDNSNVSNDVVEIQTDYTGENISFASDDSYIKMRDTYLKKHNLNLSPQFVYAKNNSITRNISNDTIIKSKFFKNSNSEDAPSNIVKVELSKGENNDSTNSMKNTGNSRENNNLNAVDTQQKDNRDTDVNESASSIFKIRETTQKQQLSQNDLVFTQSIPALMDSLDISMCTNTFDENDAVLCIDSSLLLSPKADLQPNDNIQQDDKESSNFLSGLQKKGLSFFGRSTSEETKPGSSESSGSNFNFDFNTITKKNRGGLFNMFQ